MAQLVLPLQTPPALRREDFVVTAGNHQAVDFVDAYPNWHASAGALFGPSQSGKSHLASAWAERAGGRVVEGSVVDEQMLRQATAFAIENIDAGSPDAARDRAVFSLMERGVPVLFTAQRPATYWPALMPDLQSRYRALLSFALPAPDDNLLDSLARKLFADRQLAVPDAAIAHMVRSLERTPAAIRDFIARADAKALSEKRAISLPLIRDLLA